MMIKNLKEKYITYIQSQLKLYKELNLIQNIENYLYRQMIKESNLDEKAIRYEQHLNDYSIGLFQILTSTANWLNIEDDLTDYRINIKCALKYINFLYLKFNEIPDKIERLKFAFASYNQGRGNINKMLANARKSKGLSESYYIWKYYNKEYNGWETWSYAKDFMNVSSQNQKITQEYINFIFETKEWRKCHEL